jgi:type I restriction enzyme S subunit
MKAGWAIRPLGDLCKTGAGGTPLKSVKGYYEGGNIPWLLSGEVSQGEIYEATNFITPKGLENSSARLFPPDTVLVAMYGATAGQVGILRFEASTNQAVCGILPSEYFVPEFLFYFFLHKKDELVAQAAGNAQPNISQIKIRNTGVPAVPLPEQHRIVAILDEAFDGIATAKANAEKNLQNARALFESHLQSVFTERGEGWVEKRLGDKSLLQMIDGDRGANYPKTGDFLDDGPCLFLNTKNVRPDGFEFESTMFISEEKDRQLRKGKLKRDDVVMTTRGTIGNIGLYSEDVPFDSIRINSGMLVFRPNQREILPSYLFEILRSGIVKEQIRKYTTGAAQPQLPIKTLVNFSIPVPVTLAAQSKLVKRIRAFQPETQRLESLYQQKLTALDDLKKSLLHQAFSGQL